MSAVVVGRRILPSSSPATARTGAGFPADGEEGFAPEVYSATTISTLRFWSPPPSRLLPERSPRALVRQVRALLFVTYFSDS